MNTYSYYLLAVTVIWSVLLTFYQLAYRRSANWPAHRKYLLLSWLFGLLVPLLPPLITVAPDTAQRIPAQLVRVLQQAGPVAPSSQPVPPGLTLTQLLGYLWLAGMLITGGVAAWRLRSHLRPRPVGDEWFAGYRVVRNQQVATPYAAFGRIYLPTDLPPALARTALLHEAAHLRNHHLPERLLLLVGSCALWFHPLTWWYVCWLSNAQEFEADAAVVREVPVRTYGRQLLQATLAPRLMPGLFSSPLQQRITMLTTDLPATVKRSHQLMLVVVLSLSFVACNLRQELRPNPAAEPMTFTLAALEQSPDGPKPLEGKQTSFIQAFYERVRYPEQSRRRNIIARVRTTVTIDVNGLVTDVSQTKHTRDDAVSSDQELVIIAPFNVNAINQDIVIGLDGPDDFTAEVERVVRALSPFQPARQNGRSVPAQLTFDVLFALER